ncbi:phytanoyl-CoA dioxygenase family protein [Undibacterium sp.]|uniref:phytanoyl-CoA dioxygenase family protein n=1 Tax=Undibacterium sp. TaxID=1914977 RepID=UPI00374CE869
MRSAFEDNGYAIVRNFLGQAELHALSQCCEPIADQYGLRNLLTRVPQINGLLLNDRLAELMGALGYAAAKPVRSLFFNKNLAHNWLVPWHQDLSIAVSAKAEATGYAKWTYKDGVDYVEPPVEILESIITLRVALDDADENNGALKVIPGSHLLGKLPSGDIPALVKDRAHVSCSVQAGDLLVMKPLLLHSSSKAANPVSRKVIHIELSAASLPPLMTWGEQ